jgi:hypothetical protein
MTATLGTIYYIAPEVIKGGAGTMYFCLNTTGFNHRFDNHDYFVTPLCISYQLQ